MSHDMQSAIVHGITGSHWLIERFCGDLTEAEWTHRPVPGANPAAWIVGHMILTHRSFFGLVS
ncbi:MAG: DinB family protein, partial [Planctomycetota bacterium]